MRVHQTVGQTAPVGDFSARVVRDLGRLDQREPERPSFRWRLLNAWRRRHEVPGQVALALLGQVSGVLTLQSRLQGSVYRVDWSTLAPWQVLKLQELLRTNTPVRLLPALFGGLVTDYGLLSRLVVTTAGVGFIVDAFQNSVELETMKYHALGTNTDDEAVGDGGVKTEITTNHYTSSVRPTGTTEEGASANIYKTIGTHTQATAGDAVTEHSASSSATPATGVGIDRSKFAAVNLGVGDSFQTTYELTFSAGG